MKSIRAKIICTILICSVFVGGIIGLFSIENAIKNSNHNSTELMQLNCEKKADQINSWIQRTEQSVDILANYLENDMNTAQFRADKNYADTYTETIKRIVEEFSIHTEGTVCAYVRYNPDYSNPTSGIFMSRSSMEEDFEFLTPTDFSIYEKDDLAHVGWYYIPVENKAPTWMSPYLNENINIYMISYVVPIYAEDGTSIGIVGMDIDFSQITDIVDNTSIYDSGYAFLTDNTGAITYHKDLEMGQPLSEMGDASMEAVVSAMENQEKQGELFSYRVGGEKQQLVYYALDNGMNFALTAPTGEIQAEASELTRNIGIFSLLAIIISVVIGFLISLTISRPINALTKIINQTANLDFTDSGETQKLIKSKDEVGKMAKEVSGMRDKMRTMVGQLNQTENTVMGNVTALDSIMKENRTCSEENSAATQEMAASMEEASENTRQISSSIQEVRRNSNNMNQLAEDGRLQSDQIVVRAADIKQTIQESTDKASRMFEDLNKQSQAAIEQSKSVDKINELIEDIKAISEQTNLLALNASIEAARAGDVGKGFAVVATEIGSLATQTMQTVEDINSIVSEVNNAFHNMTDCMTVMHDFLEQSVFSDYKVFLNSGEQYHQDAMSFLELIENMKRNIETLNRYIEEITGSVSDIDQTVSQSSEGITQIAEKSSQSMESVMEGYEKLRESQESLKALQTIVQQFKL